LNYNMNKSIDHEAPKLKGCTKKFFAVIGVDLA